MSKDTRPRNENGLAHGYHEVYFNNINGNNDINGVLSYKCYYVNGEEEGYEEDYDWDGKLQVKEFSLR